MTTVSSQWCPSRPSAPSSSQPAPSFTSRRILARSLTQDQPSPFSLGVPRLSGNGSAQGSTPQMSLLDAGLHGYPVLGFTHVPRTRQVEFCRTSTSLCIFPVLSSLIHSNTASSSPSDWQKPKLRYHTVLAKLWEKDDVCVTGRSVNWYNPLKELMNSCQRPKHTYPLSQQAPLVCMHTPWERIGLKTAYGVPLMESKT